MQDSRLGNKPRNIRSQNRKLVLHLFRLHGFLSVADIADKLRLSRTTILKIIEGLRDDGLVYEAGKGSSTEDGGKKPTVWAFRARRGAILTFYIRYGKVNLALFDLQGTLVVDDEESLAENEELPLILEKMQRMRDRLQAKPDIPTFLACIVAVHGNMDADRGVCLHSTYFPSWGRDFPLRERLVETLKLDCPVHVENWIRLMAFTEKAKEAAHNHKAVIFIDAGWHGITSGILFDNVLYRGRNNLSGEIGHMIVNPSDDVPCACGGTGCLESVTSCGRLLKNAALRAASVPSSLLHGAQSPVDLPTFFAAAEAGDPVARPLMDEIIGWFAVGLSNLVLFLDPEMIILEGDYAAGSYFQEQLKLRVPKVSLLRFPRETPLLFKTSSFAAVLQGAADWALEQNFGV